MSEPTREALHEAGHLCIAALHGLAAHASLNPARCWVHETHGRRETRAHACVALAGAIVDAKLEFHAAEPTGDRLKAAELIDQLYLETNDELDRSEQFQDRLWLQTSLLIDRYWESAILPLAAELTKAGKVSGARAREIVLSASPCATAAPPRRPINWGAIFARISAEYTSEA